ncbi:hypothetical protein ACFU9X_02510 [Streptomyces atratus]|uniref:hypothetical protein n=1 Tax=Streptomyces atratus TaxID=1893 RepID=UPI00367FE3EC
MSDKTLRAGRVCHALAAHVIVRVLTGTGDAERSIRALVIVTVGVKEGRAAWQGKGCCAVPAAPTPGAASAAADACGCPSGSDCC